MKCPKCGVEIHRFDLSPHCKNCGVHIMYHTQERDLSRDAKRTELEFANFRTIVAKLKAAYIAGAAPIARMVTGILAVACLVIPFYSLSITYPYGEISFSTGAIGVYKLIADGLITKLLSIYNLNLGGAVMTYTALHTLFFVLGVLTAALMVLAFMLAFVNIKKSAKFLTVTGIITAVFVVILFVFSVLAKNAATGNPDITVKIGFGAPAVLVFLIPFIITNIKINKDFKGIEIKEIDQKRIELYKKYKAGEVNLDDLPLPVFESEEERQKRENAMGGGGHHAQSEHTEPQHEVKLEEGQIFGEEPVDNDKNKINTKALLAAVIILPILVIIASSVAITVTVHKIEENHTPVEIEENPLIGTFMPPDVSGDPDEFFENISEDTRKLNDVKTDTSVWVDIAATDKTFDDDEMNVISFMKGSVQSGIVENYDKFSVNYGEKNPLPDFDTVINQTKAGFGEYVENGDKYNFSLSLKTSSDLAKAYMSVDETAINKAIDEISDQVDVKNYDLKLVDTTLNYTTNSTGDKLLSVTLTNKYELDIELQFVGGVQNIGSGEMTPDYTTNTKYDLFHAGIYFKDNTKTIAHKGYDTLKITANIKDDATQDDYVLTFTSSDPESISVDENGQIEALKAIEKPVTITATLEYMNKTYTDICLVYVGSEG